jgi:hypothetical protein
LPVRPDFDPWCAHTAFAPLRLPIAIRFSTAERFLMLSMPRKRSCFAAAALMLAGGRCATRQAWSASRCMAFRLATKPFGERLLSRVAAVASFAASGSSVQGCRTTRGLHAAMMVPDPPLLLSVAKPLMWSAWRWVATTAVSLSPQTFLMCAAIRGMCALGPLSALGSSVVPKSISTWRLSLSE